VDGITEDLVHETPWFSGYYSVVVNVNDVVAKGARPIGYADIISSNSNETRKKIAEGIRFGLEKYGLRLLNGHTHPDTAYDAVDASVIGLAKSFLPSNTSRKGDELLIATDLDGKLSRKGWVRVFDSVYDKQKSQVLSRLEGILKVAEEKFANSSKDISGPGVIGTVGLLCESSKVGAEIDLASIPKPDSVELEEWLMTYPSIGFIITTDRADKCFEVLERHGLTVGRIGRIIPERAVKLRYGEECENFFVLTRESIFDYV